VGHADLVQAKDGSWWLVCLGFRVTQPYSYYHILGRETFLAPVDWPQGGWPQVNGNGTISLDMKTPTLPLKPFSKPATRSDFDTEQLDLEWQYLRNPVRDNYSLSEKKGWLRIMATPNTLNDAKPISAILRRQTEHNFTVSTLLQFESSKDNEEAGITLIQNNNHHYDLLIKKHKKQNIIQLRVKVGSLSYIATEKIVQGNQQKLKIEGTPQHYIFSVANPDSENYSEIGKLDTRYLATEVAGGFTGVMIGLYSTSNGVPSNAKVFFDWFDYKTQ